MHTLLENLFLSSPLDQFLSAPLKTFAYYWTLSDDISAATPLFTELNLPLYEAMYGFYGNFIDLKFSLFLIICHAVYYGISYLFEFGEYETQPGTKKKFVFGSYTISIITMSFIYLYFFIVFNVVVFQTTVDSTLTEAWYLAYVKYEHYCFMDITVWFLYAFVWFRLFHREAGFYDKKNGPYLVHSNVYHYALEQFHLFTLDMLAATTSRAAKAQNFYYVVYFIFFFLLIMNVQGLLPYAFTTTSHLINTFFLSFVVFVYILAIMRKMHPAGYILELFIPSGTPLALCFLLVPIEVVSFFFRVLSLAVRLFANMMAGHTLLKVILGFGWAFLSMGEWTYLLTVLPGSILIALSFLELGVAMMQAYIFSILTCIYLKDVFEAH
jgi:ATP synthase subunit 6